ncbi:MAG TPA: ribonuclease P protein component [Jatrophihabitans sp.]|nr:ribonuclease P protein component [Jatrophihabitans sp.]
MLPVANRMRRAADFSTVVRSGVRARAGCVVVHHHPRLPRPTSASAETTDLSAAPALVGLVVGKNVGNSVVRHRTSRRLRAQLRPRLRQLPAGSGTVVRALPAAGTATSVQLGNDLENAFRRLLRQR